MASETLDWFFEMHDKISGPAKSAGSAMSVLKSGIDKVSASLKKLDAEQRSLKLAGASGLLGKNDVSKGMREIARSRDVLQTMRGELQSKLPDAAEKSSSRLGALAARAAPILAVGAAIVAGVRAVIGFARSAVEFTESIIAAGSAAENTQIAVAGMLQQAGRTDNWTASMQGASEVLDLIRRKAAKLPGESEDFIQIFRSALPKALEAGMSQVQAADFAGQFGAVGLTFGIDAEQLGRDANLLLGGRAGAGVRSWTAMSDSIFRAAQGLHLNVTNAQEFNRLTAAQRGQLLTAALQRWQPMVDAFGQSWDSISSTTQSIGADIMRLGTAPAFAALKNALSAINDTLLTSEGTPTERLKGIIDVVKTLSTSFGDAFSGITTESVGKAFDDMLPAIKAVGKFMGDFVIPAFKAFGGGLVGGIISAAGPFSKIADLLSGKPNTAAWEQIGRAIGKLIVIIGGLVTAAFGLMRVVAFVAGLGSALFNAFLSLGGFIIEGFRVGFSTAWETLKAELVAQFSALPDVVKAVLGIASPSRVFEAIGLNTAQGFQVGVEQGQPESAAALETLVAAPTAEGGARAGANVTINITIEGNASEETIESMREMLRAELASLFGSVALEGVG